VFNKKCFKQFRQFDWLVVSIPLKNTSQLGLLFPIYGTIKNVPNHQPVEVAANHLELIIVQQ